MHNNPYLEIIRDYDDLIQIKHTKPNFAWRDSMSSEQPWVFDLGCGSGQFLMGMHEKNPYKNYVGVELKYKRLVKAARKARKKKPSNFQFLQARAEDLPEWTESGSIDEIHINFPDPWPKKRHHKNRLVNFDNLSAMNRLLKRTGFISFKTDHEPYFQSVLKVLKTASEWKIIGKSLNLHESEYAEENIPTEFETIFQNQQLPIYFVKIQKK